VKQKGGYYLIKAPSVAIFYSIYDQLNQIPVLISYIDEAVVEVKAEQGRSHPFLIVHGLVHCGFHY